MIFTGPFDTNYKPDVSVGILQFSCSTLCVLAVPIGVTMIASVSSRLAEYATASEKLPAAHATIPLRFCNAVSCAILL